MDTAYLPAYPGHWLGIEWTDTGEFDLMPIVGWTLVGSSGHP